MGGGIPCIPTRTRSSMVRSAGRGASECAVDRHLESLQMLATPGHAISAPPPKLKKLRKKLEAAKAIDRPKTIWISRRKPPDDSPNPATHGGIIRQQIVEDGDHRFAGELRFAQGQRKGDWKCVLPGKPALVVAKFDGAAGLLEKAPSQTVVDEYVKRGVRSAPAHQKMSSISGTDLPDL